MKRKNRKRTHPAQTPADPFSRELQRIDRILSQGNGPAALQALDQLSSVAEDPAHRSALICTAADSLMIRGRCTEAAEVYASATRGIEVEAGGKAWLRPALGRFEALLRAADYPAAFAVAGSIRTEALKRHEAFQELINQPAREGSVDIPPRPHRPTVVLTRIGTRLLNLGFVSEATSYFEDAILLAPNGASRARQGLANILADTGEFETAERYARESILMGRFQAKTVASWITLGRARHALKRAELFEQELLRALFHHQKGPVLDRTVHGLCVAAHALGREEWLAVARRWRKVSTSPDPVIDAELLKLEISLVKRRDDFQSLLPLAARLLATPLISFSECKAAAKLLTRCHLRLARPNRRSILALPKTIAARLQIERIPELHLAMASGALEENDQSFARTLLTHARRGVADTDQAWISVHAALARLESNAGNYSRAASLQLAIAGNDACPARARIRALLDYLSTTQLSGDPVDVAQVSRRIEPLLAEIDDPFVLLDIAKLFTQVGEQVAPLAKKVAASAKALADRSLATATEPAYAVQLLKRLSLREFYEIGHPDDIVARWESFDSKRREWLWSRGDDFWEYLSLVYLSYHTIGNRAEAERLATYQLSESSTPPEGHAWLGSERITYLMDIGEIRAARDLITRVLDKAPHHTQSHLVYYWAMLDAYHAADRKRTIEMARGVQRCLGRNAGLVEKMRCRGIIANLLLQEFNAETNADFHPKDEPELKLHRAFMTTDLARLER